MKIKGDKRQDLRLLSFNFLSERRERQLLLTPFNSLCWELPKLKLYILW